MNRPDRVTGGPSGGGMVFAHDVNLGFPVDRPEWAAFSGDRGWRTAGYDDMGALTEALGSHVAAAFLPAANYYGLRDDPHYAGLASVLVVPHGSDARSATDLAGKRLGYIDPCCTTSYFAPAILLAEQGLPFEGFFSLKPVGAWQCQIDAVVAGTVDATMVEEGIWRAGPANGSATRVIGRVDRLPGPVVVLAGTVDRMFASEFLERLISTRTARPNQPSAGYAAYRRDVARAFFDRCERAFPAPAA